MSQLSRRFYECREQARIGGAKKEYIIQDLIKRAQSGVYSFVANKVYSLISRINWGIGNPYISFYVAHFKQKAIDKAPVLHSSHFRQCFQRYTFSSSQVNIKKTKNKKNHSFSWLIGFLDSVWQAHLISPQVGLKKLLLFCVPIQDNTGLCRQLACSQQI